MRACHSHLSMRWRSFCAGARSLSDLASPAEAGFAKAGNRCPRFGTMRLGRLLLFELLLQGGELGEGRIRIRFLVAAAARTVRLGVILLALGAVGTLVALAARPVAARRGP